MNGVFYDKDIIKLVSLVKSCRTVEFDKYCFLSRKGYITNLYPSVLYQEDMDILKNIKKKYNNVKIIIPDIVNLQHDFKIVRPDDYPTGYMETRIALKDLSINSFYKGHKYNIKRSIKLGVNFTVIDCLPNKQTMDEFYDAVCYSRQSINKPLKHSIESFTQRTNLIEKGKAILGITQYENKKSFVFVIYNTEEGFYYDSGYNEHSHPFTAHYCQYKIMEYLKNKNVKYYSLGVIYPYKPYDMSISNQSVDYYKNGFCTTLTNYFSLE